MTAQARNCLELFRGGNPATIKQLLMNQKASIVEELKNHFDTSDLDRLAVCLSKGE